MKKLEKIAIKMLAITIRGHIMIVKPAIGMQAVSRNGPSWLIRLIGFENGHEGPFNKPKEKASPVKRPGPRHRSKKEAQFVRPKIR